MANKMLTVVLVCVLLAGLGTTSSVLAIQPPIDTSVYYVAKAGQPRVVDPACAMDTVSQELVQNVYQPLIWYSDRPYAPVPTPPSKSSDLNNPLYWADLGSFEPVLALLNAHD